MKMYIPTDGIPVEFKEEVTLENLQKAVGGYIEVVPVVQYGGRVVGQLIVNEEGLLHNLDMNFAASICVQKSIVGNAVLLTDNDLMT